MIKISDWTKQKRNEAAAPVHVFAKEHGISSSLIKKYETGEYDSPTPLIAANFCKNFNINPSEFVDEFILSDEPGFNKDEYLLTLNSYYYGNSLNPETLSLLNNGFNLNIYDERPIKLGALAKKVPCDIVLEKRNKLISCSYFEYQKVHTGNHQSIFDAYKILINAISYALSFRLLLKHSKTNDEYEVNNYLFVTTSKNVVEAISKEEDKFLLNIFRTNSPINLILVLLPKNNSKKLIYHVIAGKDFLK